MLLSTVSRKRSEIDSPFTDGTIDTRTSCSMPPAFTLNLPSCGFLVSRVFRFAISLILMDSALPVVSSNARTFRIIPSILRRMVIAVPDISRWISDALSERASSSIPLRMVMAGAPDAIVCISMFDCVLGDFLTGDRPRDGKHEFVFIHRAKAYFLPGYFCLQNPSGALFQLSVRRFAATDRKFIGRFREHDHAIFGTELEGKLGHCSSS